MVFASGVGAAWFWTSQTFHFSLVVAGSIVAYTNYQGLTGSFSDGPDWATVATRTSNTLYTGSGGHYWLFVIVKSTNAADVYTKITCTGGATVTCALSAQRFLKTGGAQAPTDLGTLATDGSQSKQIIVTSQPLWITSNTVGTEYRFILYDLTFDQGSLPIGTHDISITVSLGDSTV
jgi:hypothetical protein